MTSGDEIDKVYVCPQPNCKAHFSRPSKLDHHLNNHDGKKPYVCNVEGCNKAYVNPSGLKRHSASHSTKPSAPYQRQFVCSEDGCDNVTFSNNDNLKRHIKRTHTRKNYKCESCSKVFPKHIQLKNHELKQHGGKDPFLCSENGCGKSFNTRSHLTQHLTTHAGRQYDCKSEGCNYNCKKWSEMRNHVKLEHPPEYKCQHCEKVFFSKSNCRIHSATHNIKRQIFLCSYEGCRRFYFFEKNLKHHISSSHEGKTFKCTHEGCLKEFKHKVALERHIKLHTSAPDYRAKKKRKCLKRRSMLARLSTFEVPKEKERKRLQDESQAPELSDSDSNAMPKVVLMVGDTQPLGSSDELEQSDKMSTVEEDESAEDEDTESEMPPFDENVLKDKEQENSCMGEANEMDGNVIDCKNIPDAKQVEDKNNKPDHNSSHQLEGNNEHFIMAEQVFVGDDCVRHVDEHMINVDEHVINENELENNCKILSEKLMEVSFLHANGVEEKIMIVCQEQMNTEIVNGQIVAEYSPSVS